MCLDGGNIKEGGWRGCGKLRRQLQRGDRGVRENFQMDNVTASCPNAAGVSRSSRQYRPRKVEKSATPGQVRQHSGQHTLRPAEQNTKDSKCIYISPGSIIKERGGPQGGSEVPERRSCQVPLVCSSYFLSSGGLLAPIPAPILCLATEISLN